MSGRLLLAAIILVALAFFVGLLLAAQTVGVEAWHDSAVPQGAFVNVKGGSTGDLLAATATPGARRTGTPTVVASAGPSNKLQAGTQSARPATPTPSLRAVSRLAARRSAGTPQRGQDSRPTGSMTGTASWFASPANVSAAGPALRAALGFGWRGRQVSVCAGRRCVSTILGDWMAADRLIDLDADVFARLAPLSQGLQEVTISW